MNEFDRWFSDDGDNTHRLNYDLDNKSVIFDVGGYRGDFAAKIYQKYNSNVYVFEPVKEFYKIIVDRFRDIDKIKVYNYGLSKQDGTQEISLDGDSSSVYKWSPKRETIQLREISNAMEELSVKHIDLIKINIEGEEFPLLNHCIEKKLIPKMNNIQVQFHNFVPNAGQKRWAIRQNLQQSHDITYDYHFVWENWRLKKDFR
jgi:FkbM family methyltransferase